MMFDILVMRVGGGEGCSTEHCETRGLVHPTSAGIECVSLINEEQCQLLLGLQRLVEF